MITSIVLFQTKFKQLATFTQEKGNKYWLITKRKKSQK